MSSINLILLGILKKQSHNAYDVANIIDTNHFNELVKISKPAVYKNLIKLCNQKFLSSKTIKDNNMPAKVFYSITEKGKRYFYKLMQENASKSHDIFFDFNSFIVNLHLLTKKERSQLLNDLQEQLYKKKQLYKGYKKEYKSAPIEGRGIINQFYAINNSLIDWLENFKKNYKE